MASDGEPARFGGEPAQSDGEPAHGGREDLPAPRGVMSAVSLVFRAFHGAVYALRSLAAGFLQHPCAQVRAWTAQVGTKTAQVGFQIAQVEVVPRSCRREPSFASNNHYEPYIWGRDILLPLLPLEIPTFLGVRWLYGYPVALESLVSSPVVVSTFWALFL